MGRIPHDSRFLCLVALCFFALSGVGSATTYYISSSSGDDNRTSTQAQSKTTPWAHFRGMANAAGNAASFTPSAGTTFVLMGCDTWGNASFPISWTWSGNSSNPISVTVDKNWYNTTNCPSGWDRPIFNAGGSVIATHNNFVRMTGGGGSYTTWNEIEFTGYTWTGSSYGEVAFFCTGACSGNVVNVTITNNYFHNWTHGLATADALYVLLGNTNSSWMSGSVIDSNVFDNTDGDGLSGAMMYGWSGTITRNVIKNVSNAILPMGSAGEIAYNNVGPLKKSFDASVHENCIETLGGTTPTWYIHDNICHDGQVGEAMMIGNNGETDYVWNNLIYNWSGNPPHFAQNSGQSITRLSFWNNTIVPVSGGQCFIEVFSPSIGRLDIQNNHCITTGALTSPLSGVAISNIDHNVLQTPTAAAGQGYTASELYVYSPVNPGDATVGVGTALSGSCSGLLAGLCDDTSYACTVDASNHVSCPARTALTRQIASWDAGAYQLTGGAPVAPPTGLAAVVH